MKICMVASRHSLDDARVVHKEAHTLRAAGHEVVLLFSCDREYRFTRHDGQVIATGTAPDGETEHLGFRVLGVPRRRGPAGKWQRYRSLARLAAAVRADVYHAHEPDLALAVALRARRMLAGQGRRALVVHDMHEYPPGGAVDALPEWVKRPAHAALVGWDWSTNRRVDHIFTANSVVRGYAQVLAPGTSVDVLYNGPALRLFRQLPIQPWPGLGHPVVLCHEGSLGFNRGLREMVSAVEQLRDRVRLLIIGDVFGAEREWLDRELDSRRLHQTVLRTGWLPYADVGEAMRGSHAGLILFRECLTNTLAGPPNKLFNYMNAGLPVLSLGFPEMRRIIREEGCGVLVHDQSVEAIVRGIETLLRSPEELACMGSAGQRAIRERYSWERMERVLLSAYRDLEIRLGQD
jgi:glycosyltransferase involved in cell wall biosynthesis